METKIFLRNWISIFFLVLIVSITIFLLFIPKQSAQSSLPVYGQVPSFNLTDSQKKNFSSESLKGKVWVADFIFTTCAGPCPIMSTAMAQLYRSYLLETDVHMVSFSVNPDYDTPEILAGYAEKYKASPDKWHFLTGPKEIIHHLAKDGFKVGSVEDVILHSAHFILVDPDLNIRGYYTGTDTQELQKLVCDIELLLKKKKV